MFREFPECFRGFPGLWPLCLFHQRSRPIIKNKQVGSYKSIMPGCKTLAWHLRCYEPNSRQTYWFLRGTPQILGEWKKLLTISDTPYTNYENSVLDSVHSWNEPIYRNLKLWNIHQKPSMLALQGCPRSLISVPPRELVSTACYAKQHVCAYPPPFSCNRLRAADSSRNCAKQPKSQKNHFGGSWSF